MFPRFSHCLVLFSISQERAEAGNGGGLRYDRDDKPRDEGISKNKRSETLLRSLTSARERSIAL